VATRAALPRTGYTPDDIANIIHNQGTSRWGPRVTPTGRPQEAFWSGARKPDRISRGGPDGRPFSKGTKTTASPLGCS